MRWYFNASSGSTALRLSSSSSNLCYFDYLGPGFRGEEDGYVVLDMLILCTVIFEVQKPALGHEAQRPVSRSQLDSCVPLPI